LVSDLLVLWDVDGTLLNAGGVGGDLYEAVFLQLFGRSLGAYAPMAGRTDRAIILETLELAGIREPRRYVDPFIAGLRAHAQSVGEAVSVRGHALPGAAMALAALAQARVPQQRPVPAAETIPAGAVPVGAVPAGAVPVRAVPARAVPAGAVPAGAMPGRAGAGGRTGSAGGRLRPFFPDGPGRVRQSVLTGNVRQLAEVKLAALGLRDPLDLCIGAYGDDHEVRAELVHVARRRAEAVHGRVPGDFAGESTVVVGDTPLDIEAALATGARAVGVATGAYPATALAAAGAHVVLNDLTDTGKVMRALLS
jgi:phosphoglycolate phosphatase-like HAD superfamily hydrolase